jgi:hypothetical protein
MKALSFGLLLAITTLSSSHAQRSPDSLPAVTVDCYQSFAAQWTFRLRVPPPRE